MKSMIKRLIMLFAVVMLSIFVIAIASNESYAAEVVDSGTCGDNVTWTLTGTDTDMMLTISGDGAMYDYSESTIPWASKRSKIKKVTVEEGITSLGDYAFYSLNKLTEVSLPAGITSIRKYCFANDVSLASIDIPDYVTSIGEYAFSGCSSLVSITVPDGVTSIAEYAFSGCSSLASITIPDGVTSIGYSAFQGCSSLTSITIPDSVTSIGSHAFYDCGSLASIEIHDSVISIGSHAFVGCSSLVSITIPDGVTSIAESAFQSCSSLASITIPDSVTSIGLYAFQGCSSLASIIIPDSVTSIGRGAFQGCSSLAIITIPDSVTSIGGGAFQGCSSLASITIPDSVTSIGGGAFQGCSSLVSITIPDSVTSIEASAFGNCSSLASITIPDSVTSIEASAFGNCSSLASITIPDSVISIGDSVFRGCSSLAGIIIPDGVTSIGWDVFSGCSSLVSITIPGSVTSIGGSAFQGCSSLASITIPDGVTSIEGSVFQGCSSLVSITIPDSVTSIGRSAFQSCSSLVSITIPDSVTSIGTFAFWGCSSLESITIPNSVTSIDNTAFQIDFSLKYVFFSGSEQQWQELGAPSVQSAVIHYNATGHTWNSSYTVDKDATYTEEGSESIHCSVCDAIKEGSSRTIAKTEHNYGEWTVIKAATCTEDGSKEKVCTECGDKVVEVITATGHTESDPVKENEVAATCIVDGSYDEVIYCSVCKEEVGRETKTISAGHRWNTYYTVDKEPTYDEEGSESIHCSVCGDIQEGSARSIPQLDRSEQKGEDGTPVGKGASAEAAEKEITNLPNDNDPKGAVFGKLMLKSTKQTKNSITLSWKGVSGATSYVIYGNVCGKTKKLKKLNVTGGKKYTVKKIAGKSLKKSTFHKFIVVALDSSNHVVSTSKIIHATTKGGKNGNPTKVTVSKKVKKNKLTLKKGKTFKLAGKATGKKVKKHVAVRYESSNPEVAKVSKKGVIKGLKKGKCKIYVFAHNGVCATIKLTIK